MRHRSRILSWLLVAAMTLSMAAPTAAYAASDIGVSAAFAEDVTLREGAGGYDASMSVDLTGVDGITGYHMMVDWTSLDGYVKSARFNLNDEMADSVNGHLDKYNNSIYLGPLTSTQKALVCYCSGGAASDLEGVAIVDFKLSSEIPAGRYSVDVTLADLVDAGNKPCWDPHDTSNYLTATGVLTVRDAEGNVPDGPDEPAVYQISPVVGSGPATGSASFSKTEAEAGEVITVTLAAAAGYELDAITATDTANGASVGLAKVSDTEYTFVMPKGNVQVQVSYKLSEPAIDAYAIKTGAAVNGTMHTNGVDQAEAGETVTVFVKPNDGYEIVSVNVVAGNGVDVTVEGGSEQTAGAYKYTFVMSESDVTINAVFRDVSVSNKDEVAAGHILTRGAVLTSNGNPLPGARIQLVYNTGAYKGQVAAETVSGSDGTFTLPEASGSYSYTLQAIYDTGIQQGKPANPGYAVYSKTVNISSSACNVTGKGEIVSQTLTVSLYYEWDVDNDGEIERVHAGKDDAFLTPDDFYEAAVGGKTVSVYADSTGGIQSEKAYYHWEVNTDGVKEQVFVGGGYKAGTSNDYYLYDVDHDPKTADIEVTIGEDRVPATSDDCYVLDVNNDGNSETVSAGADGLIATADDWYRSGNETVYAGEDEIAGTSDDWYLADGDGHGEDEKIFVGKDRLPHTGDDFYQRDVNGSGDLEAIYAGGDKAFNTSDDYYEDAVAYTGGQEPCARSF